MLQCTGSSLVPVMACRLFGTKPLLEPTLLIVNWTFRNTRWISKQSIKLFIEEFFLNVVYEIADIFSGGGYCCSCIYGLQFCCASLYCCYCIYKQLNYPFNSGWLDWCWSSAVSLKDMVYRHQNTTKQELSRKLYIFFKHILSSIQCNSLEYWWNRQRWHIFYDAASQIYLLNCKLALRIYMIHCIWWWIAEIHKVKILR